jgi:uncharacterized protein
MQIQLENADTFAIQAYSESQVTINGSTFQESLRVSQQGILTDWPIKSITELENKNMEALLKDFGEEPPEIIIIGHKEQGIFAPFSGRELLTKKQIGFESMSIGAACRTYNVLLGEKRKVVLGLIFGIK